jgi:hypothetical protein
LESRRQSRIGASMIRVIRVLEYEYESAEFAEQNMLQWFVPPNGAKKPNDKTLIRSATIVDMSGRGVGEE